MMTMHSLIVDPSYMNLSDSLRMLSSCFSPKYLQMHGLHALIAITRVHRALALNAYI